MVTFNVSLLMPDIQEAKRFEFTVQIPPPPDLYLYTPLLFKFESLKRLI